MKKLISFILILLTIAGFGVALGWLERTKPQPVAELESIPPTRVMSTRVINGDVQKTHRLTGRLIPARRAELHFELAGLIRERHIEAGQDVLEDEVLMQLDQDDQQDRVIEAELMLQQEQESLQRDQELLKLVTQQRRLLQRELDRQQSLTDRSLLPQSQMDETRRALISARVEESRLKHSVSSSQTRQNRAKLDVEKAKRDQHRTTLKAPFAGTINSVKAEVGEYVTSGQVVIELVKTNEFDLQLDVSGRVASALKRDQIVNVSIVDTGATKSGRLIALQPDPDPQTHTHAIRIRISGEDAFAGQLAQVTLGEAVIKNALQVPVSAVLQENTEAYVFLIESDRVIRRDVQLIGREGKYLIVSGLEADQLIVSQDVAALVDGQEISLMQVPEQTVEVNKR